MSDLYNTQMTSQIPQGVEVSGGEALREQASFLQKQSDFFKNQAERQERTYLYSLQKASSDSIEEAYRAYQYEPEKLDEELFKVKEKMSSQVPDKYKETFNVDFISVAKQKVRLAEAAKEKRDEAEYINSEVMRAEALERELYDRTFNLTSSFASPEDAYEDITRIYELMNMSNESNPLNAKRKDGSDAFTAAQKIAYQHRLYEKIINAGVLSVAQMTPQELEEYAKMLENDNVVIAPTLKEGEYVMLQDLIGNYEVYDTFKQRVLKLRDNMRQIEKKEKKQDVDLANTQLQNQIVVDDGLNEIKKTLQDKKVDQSDRVQAITSLLRLSDDVQTFGKDGLGDNDYKNKTKAITALMMEALNQTDPDVFDDAVFSETGMSTALQIITENKLDNFTASVVLRDFWDRAKNESNFDVMDDSSETRDKAKSLVKKSITSIQEKISAGQISPDTNTIFLYGKPLRKERVNQEVPVSTDSPYKVIQKDDGIYKIYHNGLEIPTT